MSLEGMGLLETSSLLRSGHGQTPRVFQLLGNEPALIDGGYFSLVPVPIRSTLRDLKRFVL